MFQSFTDQASSDHSAQRLAALRQKMRELGMTVYLVPHSDEYQNEYLPEMAQRLAWLTGFTGSAGFAVITDRQARVFVDGRYTIQAQEQLDLDHFQPADLISQPPSQWLKANTGPNDRVGFDPWLLTHNQFRKFEKALTTTKAVLMPQDNLIDRIWTDQPAPPLEPVSIHEIEHAGVLARDKISALQKDLSQKDLAGCLITDPTSICWLFNIRGADVVHLPLTLARLYLPADGLPQLFIDKRKLDREVEAYLTQLADLIAPGQLVDRLPELAANRTVLADPDSVPVRLTQLMESADATLQLERDPIVVLKACKNPVELDGARIAHLRDGVAVTRFLYWLDQQPGGSVTEIDAARQLEQIRDENARHMNSELMEIAFDTISASGPNSALPHYRVTETSNRTLANHSIYLVDSGAQYRDGTTDITRTVAIGQPPRDAIENNTLVLKGHIAVALARFPKGTRGQDIDPLARMALWRHGKDFSHGTGHGVGAYLGVHEGPQRLSRTGVQELLPGMILSNEPGYYVEGEYGIRIENLVVVSDLEEMEGGNTAVMGFETITIAPIDLRLVDAALLSDDEIHWLNAYHGWVRRKLQPHLSDDEFQWLQSATQPLSRELPAASA